VYVESEGGAGTRFVIYLPRIPGTQQNEPCRTL
jgi:hypothetical protein